VVQDTVYPATFGPVRVEEQKETGKKKKGEKSRKLLITNDFYRVLLGENGEICSFTERNGEFEYVAENESMNTFRLYQDVNGCYDAWELSRMYEAAEVSIPQPKIRSVETLGGQVVVTTSLKADHFDLHQKIVFRPDSPVVDFQTEVDWRERHRILKVDFPTAVFTKEICQEIPFGYIKRPTHRSRQADKDRYETCQHRYSALSDGEVGIAVLNNSKYGMSAKDSAMALTLLKSAIYPDGHADQGKQTFRYGLCLFRGPLGKSNVAKTAMEYNLVPTDLQTTEKPVKAENAISFFEINGGNTVIDGIKPAFDDKDAIVLRIVEEGGSHAVSTLRVPGIVKKAFSTNMLEEEDSAAELPLEKDGTIKLVFRPFEIKTILLRR
jgi:alpha-mannosidase